MANRSGVNVLSSFLASRTLTGVIPSLRCGNDLLLLVREEARWQRLTSRTVIFTTTLRPDPYGLLFDQSLIDGVVLRQQPDWSSTSRRALIVQRLSSAILTIG